MRLARRFLFWVRQAWGACLDVDEAYRLLTGGPSKLPARELAPDAAQMDTPPETR